MLILFQFDLKVLHLEANQLPYDSYYLYLRVMQAKSGFNLLQYDND